jgi:predicted regulator of Ras-like GTPase activity (Roadblock/LC7/MglB family)
VVSVVEQTREFSWLLRNFVEQTAGVDGAVAVSSDGLLMAMSSSLTRADAEPVAAIISGLVSLGRGAAGHLGFEGLERMVVGMRRGVLLVASVSDGSAMGVIARAGCDIGAVGYQMTLLVERAGTLLTPALVAELRQEVLRS